MHHGIFFGRLSNLGRPGRSKMVSIKIFTVSRDRFGLPDKNFSIQAIAVVPVFSVFFDRPWWSLWCFHIIVPVAWTQFEKTGATGTTIWKPGSSDRGRPSLFSLFRSSAVVPVVFPYNRPGRLDVI